MSPTPLLEIVSPNATPEEIAALVTVLAALGGGEEALALADGIAVSATPGSVSISSLCRFLRRSTIEKNASTAGAGCGPAARKSRSWS